MFKISVLKGGNICRVFRNGTFNLRKRNRPTYLSIFHIATSLLEMITKHVLEMRMGSVVPCNVVVVNVVRF